MSSLSCSKLWGNCNTLQHTATHRNIPQHTATHRNTLQHTATHCNTLQHTTTRRNTLQHTATHRTRSSNTATHCNTLQHTATQGATGEVSVKIKTVDGTAKVDISENSFWYHNYYMKWLYISLLRNSGNQECRRHGKSRHLSKFSSLTQLLYAITVNLTYYMKWL